MVSNFDAVQSQSLNHVRDNRGPRTRAFPLSSPAAENITSFKPVTYRSQTKLTSDQAPSRSFTSSLSDDDVSDYEENDDSPSDTSSRYSELKKGFRAGTDSYGSEHLHKRNKPSEDKRKPDLNIVTNFSQHTRRFNTDGIQIDQVQAQQPRVGRRYAASIVSAKAEHVAQSSTKSEFEDDDVAGQPRFQREANIQRPDNVDSFSRSVGRAALSRLKELQAARKKVTGSEQGTAYVGNVEKKQPQSLANLRAREKPSNPVSPDDRVIVIGISVPEADVHAHRPENGETSALSINTPETPAIRITPVKGNESWRTGVVAGNIGPNSNMYSNNTSTNIRISHEDLSRMPRIPASHTAGEQDVVTAGATIVRRDAQRGGKVAEGYQSRYEVEDDGGYHTRRMSSGSEHHILRGDLDPARHKSQGWWNLMLSPMLSRKSTLKSIHTAEATPPVPALPFNIDSAKTTFTSPSDGSPGTPRRLGLASARASVWSRWTSWERQRDIGTRDNAETVSPDGIGDNELTEEKPENPRSTEDHTVMGKGLAADYYHACAVEQLSGKRYFECQNHSCEHKLPVLHSIFDVSAVRRSSTRQPAGFIMSDEPLAAPDDDIEGALPTETRDMTSPGAATIRSEPEELSPNVRQATTGAVMKAKAITPPLPSQDIAVPSDTQPRNISLEAETDTAANKPRAMAAIASNPASHYPNIATVIPVEQPPIPSPGPISPGMQRSMTAQGAVPMAEIEPVATQTQSKEFQVAHPAPPAQITIHNQSMYSRRQNPPPLLAPIITDVENKYPTSSRASTDPVGGVKVSEEDDRSKKEEAANKKSLLMRLKCWGRRKEPANDGPKQKKRRWTLWLFFPFFLIVVGCVLLAIFLTRSGDGTPVESQWLNLTGYPPIPTGISTIARPDIVKQQSNCVAPSTLWSCSLPKENQFEVTPNNADQPNFRFQINFKNGTVPANMTIPVESLSKRSTGLQRRADDPFTNDVSEPNPQPPSRADQLFMGNTTDNVTEPFDGEQTPFFITFVPVFPIDPSDAENALSTSGSNRRLLARQSSNTAGVPAPEVLSDGSAAPANLLPTNPFPSSQPIKLYNRGLVDEHYGFYIYYDKSIFLHSTAPFNLTEFAINNGIDPQDENGGATRDVSRLRCTFSQTRFLVRIWTNPAFGATLLPFLSTNVTNATEGSMSSATDFSRPGSFPYPATITLDRHGGNINKKALYCYGVDELQVIQEDVRGFLPEARGIGGQLINQAPSIVNGSLPTDSEFDQDAGGIDGGTGGCGCMWQNWN